MKTLCYCRVRLVIVTDVSVREYTHDHTYTLLVRKSRTKMFWTVTIWLKSSKNQTNQPHGIEIHVPPKDSNGITNSADPDLTSPPV